MGLTFYSPKPEYSIGRNEVGTTTLRKLNTVPQAGSKCEYRQQKAFTKLEFFVFMCS